MCESHDLIAILYGWPFRLKLIWIDIDTFISKFTNN